MDLMESLMISAAGMRAQGAAPAGGGGKPRQRGFGRGSAGRRSRIAARPSPSRTQLDRELGLETVQVSKVGEDRSDFRMKYDPGNPAADAKGYVKLPNVNSLIEMTDMREAQRSLRSQPARRSKWRAPCFSAPSI